MSTPAQAQTDDLATALRHAASLLDGDPALAEQQALEILDPYPNDVNGLTLLGAARRLQRKFESALETLEKAIKHDPGLGLARQEIGITLLAVGRGAEAVSHLRKAVKLLPESPVAWKALAEALTAQGEAAEARKARRCLLAVTVKNPELLKAADFLYEGRLAKAEAVCRDVLKNDPIDVSAIRMLADIGIRLRQYGDSQKLLERCLELAPDFHLARNDYANVLSKRQQYEASLAELKKLLAVEPDNPNHLLLKASVLVQIAEFESAIKIYDQVLEHYPRQPRSHLSKGHALKTLGRHSEGIEAYRTAISHAPELGEAYWSLANLKTFRFDEEEISAMRRQVKDGTKNIEDYYHLCFALGKALEDREQYDESFHCYRRGNAVRKKTVQWDGKAHHDNMQRLIAFFDAGFFASRDCQGAQHSDPIFIVGLPRAGSTLLEQILASHSQVEGTMELPDIISIARRLSGKKRRFDESRYPDVLAEFAPAQLTELGEEYMERTRIQRRGAPFFIDKMPNNFSHIGLIHLMLPNAKIIDARRHPLACCFSGFKQLFASGQNFTYDLTDIGQYYRNYVALMDHWDQVLAGRVLRMEYETVVADTEFQVRRLLDHCGLPFEQECLRFYETKRAVRTASSEQVRQPIYGGAVEQWRHYLAHLDPLIEALGPVVDEYGADLCPDK
ncbi:MAG: sulfotransferase [Proteobacteria bacterium]|nr:sulfotransferase [Pseudomonadota bacterium]